MGCMLSLGDLHKKIASKTERDARKYLATPLLLCITSTLHAISRGVWFFFMSINVFLLSTSVIVVS